MCGILFSLTETVRPSRCSTDKRLLTFIQSRGPDSLVTKEIVVGNLSLSFTASVLHLRGPQVVPQPVSTKNNNILCWNGEAWSGLDFSVSENDTLALSSVLAKQDDVFDILRVFEGIRGPYAFVYYQEEQGKLWYGRDILGRRSLLFNQTDGLINLSSVAHRDPNWREVDVTGIHCYDLARRRLTTFSWSSKPSGPQEMLKSYPYVNSFIPPSHCDTTQRSSACYTTPVYELKTMLLKAIRVRTVTLPDNVFGDMGHSRVAVMYSGGVDCAVIARLLHETLPAHETVDLLNVSFENPRSISNAMRVDPSYKKVYETPDRLTGLQGYKELCQTCPDRQWRFVTIDVPYIDATKVKEDVLDLMYPNDSIMDYSIALAFYFCARGIGTIRKGDGAVEPYTCTSRVYFSGLGADEQLGGYSRHSAAWKRGGYSELIRELQCDLDRIPSRNLGRDDRILAHFGREVRWPFLDENVITFLSNLRVDVKMSFATVDGGGDKVILRDLARFLGIPKAAGEKKRAIQFGSRSARMEIEAGKADRVRGHDKQL